jgi:type IV pilus assembly protein PilY1
MICFNSSFKSLSGGLLLSLCFSMPLLAEDIEIYTTVDPNAASVQANVLFVLDTSGSMDRTITVTTAYDPSTTYANDGCGTDRIYWSTSGTPPGCGGNKYFYSSALHCDHALESLEAEGFYLGNMAQKRTNEWKSINTNNNSRRDWFIECEADQGLHGSNSTPIPNSYIQHGTNAWGNSQTVSTWPGDNYTIYSSNYMNFLADGGGTREISRFQAVKEAMDSIVSASNDINIGLMGFNGWSNYDGGQVLFAMEDIDTARQPFIDFILDPDFDTNSWTPLSETYFEAIHYFGGKTPPYGTAPNANPPSVASSMQADGTYLSPITHECQANHIVFLTDGDPTKDTLSTAQLTSLPGYTDTSCASTTETTVEGDQAIIESNCLDRLSGWAFTNDVAEEAADAHEGKQNIITHTIGFGDGISEYAIAMLERAATFGGGTYYEAQNPNELVSKFNEIISGVMDQNTSFASPAVSVNAFNRSTHLNDLYFTLFKPATSGHWPGNLKKYELLFEVDTNDRDGDGDTTEKLPFVADANGSRAIDENTGFFNENALSIWSVLVDGKGDGNEVIKGGAANEFQNLSDPRKVYTFSGIYIDTNGVFVPAANAALTAAINRVESTNTEILDDVAMLNIEGLADKIAGTPRRETLLGWAAGFDVFDDFGVENNTTEMRPGMGSPLHSQPALVEHGTKESPDLVAYVATNDGYLHAFDTDDGKEIFSFIPQELLSNLNTLMDGDNSNKIYGLDGDVVAWVNDKDNDGINGSDHVYLYIGMRRGGNNIYSVDVTDPDAPSLRWVIKGGVGDYSELGQTWSAVNVGKIKDGATEKTVLIFGGGYDTNQDDVSITTEDAVGRAVFIADATTGQLLWSAGPAGSSATTEIGEMKYSVPARVTVLDLSGDGLIDRLYAADMGGQVLRFDINNNNGSALAGSVSGGRIANISGDGITNARRFYYPPDVALIAERGKSAYLALGITSGYRAHPLNTDIHDRIYLIKDNDVYNTPNPFITLTENDLYDATLNLAGGNGTLEQNKDALDELTKVSNRGWYINLDDETGTNTWKGEKGLSEALFLSGTLIVTTYVPPDGTVATDICLAGASGSGKVYFLDVLDATPAFKTSADLRPARHGPGGGLKKEGIPPTPRVMITDEGVPTLCIGTECIAAEGVQGVRKTFWHEVEQ